MLVEPATDLGKGSLFLLYRIVRQVSLLIGVAIREVAVVVGSCLALRVVLLRVVAHRFHRDVIRLYVVGGVALVWDHGPLRGVQLFDLVYRRLLPHYVLVPLILLAAPPLRALIIVGIKLLLMVEFQVRRFSAGMAAWRDMNLMVYSFERWVRT